MKGMVCSGVFENNGHFVSFKINDHDVDISDSVLSQNAWHTKKKKMEIYDAIEYQQTLINFGYEHNLNMETIKIRLL